MQDAALRPPRTKYPQAGAGEQYSDVLLLNLAGIFTGRAGRPDTIDGGGEEATIDDWERISRSEAEAYKEEYEEEYPQDFPEDEVGQETPSSGSSQLDQILASISALASSVALLQAQADRE